MSSLWKNNRKDERNKSLENKEENRFVSVVFVFHSARFSFTTLSIVVIICDVCS